VDRPNLARRLRRIVHLVLAVCVVVLIVAMLPGRRVYTDANNCSCWCCSACRSS
jgi:hypothetical protein